MAGVGNLKGKEWDHVKKFDVIGLMETYVTEKREEEIRRKLEGYDIKIRNAVRVSKRGRAKGGMVMTIRKGITPEVKRLEGNNKTIGAEIFLENEKWLFGTVYMREKRRENYDITWNSGKEHREEYNNRRS